MDQGKIWVADDQGRYLIKMTGDVRLTLCLSFDQFISDMFGDEGIEAILIDLTEAESVDSTTLGLMAKIALRSQDVANLRPAIVSRSAGINRLLTTMGFSELFDIVDDTPPDMLTNECLTAGDLVEQEIKNKVLEAHRILMKLNDENKETFKDLVKTLEEGR